MTAYVYTPPMTSVTVLVDDPTGGPPCEFTIPGEPTAVPELFVIPSAFTGGYDGRWVVVHAPTALVIPVYTATPGEARHVAARLAALEVDWTVTLDDATPAERAATLSGRIGPAGWSALADTVAELVAQAGPVPAATLPSLPTPGSTAA